MGATIATTIATTAAAATTTTTTTILLLLVQLPQTLRLYGKHNHGFRRQDQ
jgi:hypothetical protein